MKYIAAIIFMLFSTALQAQTAIDSYNLFNNPAPATTSNSALGWFNASSPYSNATTYDIFYGKLNAVANGTTREVVDFSISSGPSVGTYIPVPFSVDQPYDTVIVNRINNAFTTGRRVNSLFEFGSFDGGSNSLYLQPQYNASMEDIINRKYLNVGSDNTFVNDNSSTTNNIERLDLIFSNGISANTADLARVGILINDRGGNDFFKIAAITSIDANKNVTGLGNLVSITPTTWGTVGPAINTVVMSKEEADPFLRPKENIGTQTISGVFISLLDMGITTGGTFIRGVSLFPNDVIATMDLIGLTDVPTNTSGGAIGGLDLMAGGGFFREMGTLVILPVQFIDFSVQPVNDGTMMLNWSANHNESNPGDFVIERSPDGFAWQAIGRQVLKSRQTAAYVFTDRNPNEGNNFYRLKITGQSGDITYSKIVLAKLQHPGVGAGIQYAAGSNFARVYTGNLEGKFIVRLIDYNGRLLSATQFSAARNSTTQISLSHISTPNFVMQLIHNDNLLQNQFILR